MEIFSHRIKILRESKGYTQKQVAEMLGYTQSYYSKFEYNQREPNLETVLMIAEIYDCSVDFLLGRDKYNSFNPEDISTPPMIKGIKSGEIIYAPDSERLPIPDHLLAGRKGFTFKIKDEAMIEAGIHDGDIVVCLFEDELIDNAVMVVAYEDNLFVRRVQEEDDSLIILIPENSSMRISVAHKNDVFIVGKVIAVYREFGK